MKLPRLSLLSQICLTHFISHIHMLVLPVLIPVILLQRKEISFIQVGFAISVFNIVSALVQAPVGIFVDRLGPKRVLLGGLLLGSLCFISMGLVQSYYWLVFAMGLAGVANAVYHPADYAILSQNVVETRMGRAFSLHTFSGSLGFAVTPVFMLSVAEWINIEAAFIIAGIIGLVAAIILYPRSRNEMHKALHPTNITKTEIKKHTDHKFPLITPAIFLMLVLFFFLSLSGGSIQNFSVSSLMTGYNISLKNANAGLTAFLICSAIGVLLGGHLADYYKQHGLIAAAALIVTASIAFVIATTSFSSAIFVIFLIGLMGLLSGIIAPSRDMLVRNVSPKGAEGRVFGIVSTGFNIGGTVGPILFGWILDHQMPRGVFWCTGIFMALTAVIAIYQELHKPTTVR